MDQLRFDGRVAIVTGAGGNPSLGRAHALLLAARGAHVVVNDIGELPAALGYPGIGSAQAVVDEIRAADGSAVADTHSVADEAGAAAIVQAAIDAFGRVDIVVNNAGVCRVVSFDDMTPADFRHTIEVNLMGTVQVCRAAWPHLKAQGYGRIVNIASGSMTGLAWQTAYAAAKGGVFSFTRALASEGVAHGIRANVVTPGALTRMVHAAQGPDSSFIAAAADGVLAPELVSPTIAVLAHEQCPVTGECIESIGGRVDRFYLARTPGFTDPAMTVETLAAHWDEVMAGAAPGISRHDESDPRQWSPRAYRPLSA
ncbi:MAG: SDR family NAD(P)-dependent oxidoreductase [Sphingomonadales bacterium]|nr:SDR family NAD(P)-dependent oxidoreductase [Sphingomonadales bacterium]